MNCSPVSQNLASISKSCSNLNSDNYALQEVVIKDNLAPPPCATDRDNLGAAYTTAKGLENQAGEKTRADERTKKMLYSAINTGLYHAALNGNWKMAQSTLNKYPNRKITDSITKDNENILHIAAATKHSDFVKWAIDEMETEDMTLLNKHGNSVLSFAATSGTVEVAKLLVQKNEQLPLIYRNSEEVTPLFIAISYKRQQMASYLFSVTLIKQLTPVNQIQILIAAIYSDFYDIGLKMLKENPKLATMKNTKHNGETALHVLATKPSALGSRPDNYIWTKWINSCIKGICNKDVERAARELVSLLWEYIRSDLPEKEMLNFIKHPTILLHDAARAGNVEFLYMLIYSYPDIVWEEDDDGKSIFHIAVENRLEKVFKLIHEISGPRDFSTRFKTTVKEKYNMLHLAAKLPAPNHLNRVSGAALQMQRELIWFNEVEKIALPYQREAKCNADNGSVKLTPRELLTKEHKELHKNGELFNEVEKIALPYQREAKCDADDGSVKLTPRELFTKEHKELHKNGEEWMKNTANSCMVVATLIATVVFAAAFTVPGGNSTEGHPMFQKKNWFSIFVITDAIAMIASSTSILIFLSILTSRYAEVDFLLTLPLTLLFGLGLLFVSIVCMVVAFSATFFLLNQRAHISVPATIGAMAIIPVSSFGALQFRLWVDTFHNTCMSRFVFKPRRHKFLRKFFAPSEN